MKANKAADSETCPKNAKLTKLSASTPVIAAAIFAVKLIGKRVNLTWSIVERRLSSSDFLDMIWAYSASARSIQAFSGFTRTDW